MIEKLSGLCDKPWAKRWGPYIVKVIVVLGVVFAIGRTAEMLPSAAIGLFWVALSTASSIGLCYHSVVRKSHRQMMLKDGGRLSRLNNGRIVSFFISFVASAIFIAGLILEAPKWHLGEWVLMAAGAAIFPLIASVGGKFLKKEYQTTFAESKTILMSCVIVGLLLCAAYLGATALQPAPAYSNATEAFVASAHPLENSPSPLLSEAGKILALIDGFTAYGLGKAAEASFTGYLVWKIVICASAFFGMANLFGFCSISWAELKRTFQPIGESKEKESSAILKRFVVVAIALPLCLFAAFLYADSRVGSVLQTDEGSAAERFIRDQVGVAVYIMDGKYYEQQEVQTLIEEAAKASESLSTQAEETLVPLINASYDARVSNVDSYLDWYYSLPADYERLATMVTGSAESYAEEQFTARIEDGIDDTEIYEKMTSFTEQAEKLETDLKEKLAQYEVTGLPDYLYIEKGPLQADIVTTTLEPSHKILDGSARLGLSAAAGVGAGIIAKRLTERALVKPFFNKIVTRIATMLATRGGGAAVGGVGGSVVGPLGTAVGIAVGTAAGIGIDFGLLKLDEYQNREQYKQEIIDTIEESRAEMLAIVQK